MGVYIKDMDLPKGADECRIIIRANGQVIIDKKTYWEETEAVPVPPHGSLIEKHDVFKLITAFPEVDKLLPVEFMEALYNLPTFIPADVPDNNVGNIPAEEGET